MQEQITICALIYDESNRILLVNSNKWKGYGLPGGKPKEGESEEITLHREIKEEVGIEITDLLKFEEIRLKPTKEIDNLTTFIVKPYIARALITEIMPNKEITGWKWFDPRALRTN